MSEHEQGAGGQWPPAAAPLPPGAPPPPSYPPPPGGQPPPGWSAGAPYAYAAPAPRSNAAAVIAHLGFIGGGFIIPLVVYLVSRDDPFARRHATEALNFQLTLLGIVMGAMVALFGVIAVGFGLAGTSSAMAGGIAGFAAFAAFGLLWLAVLGLSIAGIAFSIIGLTRASRWEDYRYPFTIRFVKP